MGAGNLDRPRRPGRPLVGRQRPISGRAAEATEATFGKKVTVAVMF